MNAATASYGADDIEVLSGLDPVRRRPSMFTDTSRPNHLASEVLDNSVDEALGGHCKNITVTVYDDGSVAVEDDGRGMPADIHAETGLSGIELILTRLHAGAKFSREQYRYAGGLHGVGVSVVNALSQKLDVTVKRSGQRYAMHFADGRRAYKGRKPRKPAPAEVTGTVGKNETGTCIRFWPDGGYFDKSEFNLKDLRGVLRSKALLCAGLSVTLIDQRKPNDPKTESWQYADGLPQYLAEQLDGYETLIDESLRIQDDERNDFALDCVIQWTPPGVERRQESYVNLVPTTRGGTHVSGLRGGLTNGLREFAEFHKLLPKDIKLTPADVWEGLHFVLSVKLAEPQFAGQTKESLASRECIALVSDAVKSRLALWLNFHPEAGEKVVAQAIAAAQRRLKAAKKTPRRSHTSGPALPGKLADCISTNASECEIFLVEGDSAGGSARQARNRNTQAILPLRGKILNTWEVDSDRIMDSKEVHDITVALGVTPNNEDLSRLRYHRVCILADADSDGLHIATLLCGLFTKHFRTLIEKGHVYVAQPPLYRIDVGKQTRYALSDDELEKLLRRLGKKKTSVTRFKGLGEMSAIQLRDTVMKPSSRRLVQMTLDAGDGTDDLFGMLLAKKRAADRRAWLEASGHLSAS